MRYGYIISSRKHSARSGAVQYIVLLCVENREKALQKLGECLLKKIEI